MATKKTKTKNKLSPHTVVAAAITKVTTTNPRCQRCVGVVGVTGTECNSGQDKVELHRQSQQPNLGGSQLIHAVDWDGVTDTIDDEEATNWIFLNKSQLVKKQPVSFQSD
jgi:hypothetical protein